MKKGFQLRNLLILGLVLCLSLSVGCGGKKEKGAKKADGSQTTSIILPKLDIKEKTVKFLTWDDPNGLTQEGSYFYQVNEALKKNYGCELEFVYANYADVATKLVTGVLSGSAPDLVKVKSEDFPNNIYKDLVDSPDDLIDWNSDLWSGIKSLNDRNIINGKHYLIQTESYLGGVVFYNNTMFEENGLTTPWELYKNNEWTWSKLEETAITLTQDTDRDGIIDIYGWAAHPLRVLPTCGADFVTTDETGRYVNNLRDPVIAKCMNFILNTGMCGTDCRQLTLNPETPFANNQLAMFWDEYWRIGSYAEEIKSGHVGFAPAPKMDDADRYYGQSGGECIWMAKNAPNREGAVAYMNVLRMREADTETVKALRAETMEQFGFNEEQMKQYDEFKSGKFELISLASTGIGEWGNTAQWELFNESAIYENPWSSVCEKYCPILDSEIETANMWMTE